MVNKVLFCKYLRIMKRDLEPAHEEQELEESEQGEVEITLVFIEGLTPDQATTEEGIDGYRHNLQ